MEGCWWGYLQDLWGQELKSWDLRYFIIHPEPPSAFFRNSSKPPELLGTLNIQQLLRLIIQSHIGSQFFLPETAWETVYQRRRWWNNWPRNVASPLLTVMLLYSEDYRDGTTTLKILWRLWYESRPVNDKAVVSTVNLDGGYSPRNCGSSWT